MGLGIGRLIPIDISILLIGWFFFTFLLFYLGIELLLAFIGFLIFQLLSNYEIGAYRLDKKASTSFSSKRRAYKEATVFFLKFFFKSAITKIILMFKYFAPIPIIFYLNNQVKIPEPFFYVKTEIISVEITKNIMTT